MITDRTDVMMNPQQTIMMANNGQNTYVPYDMASSPGQMYKSVQNMINNGLSATSHNTYPTITDQDFPNISQNNSRSITNDDIMNFLTSKFNEMSKRLDKLERLEEKVNSVDEKCTDM